jgi:hypothetical protein
MRPLLAAAAIAVSLVAFAAFAASAVDLNGKWEVQSLSADRDIKIEQKGTKVVAYRVLWPEFEGQKYKLEHLYRGTLNGNSIKGQLLVKEEELPDFEVLREFVGAVEADGALVLDGLPLKRTDAGGSQEQAPAAPQPKGPGRPTAAPELSQLTIRAWSCARCG